MTQVSCLLPLLSLRDIATPRQAKKPKPLWGRHTNTGKQKYDLMGMARERIAGMTWAQIAEKHCVVATGLTKPAARARALVLNSGHTIAKLTPAEATAL